MIINERESYFHPNSAQCDAWLMMNKNSVVDFSKVDEFNEAIRNNELICPRPRYCSEPGTLIRSELYKDLKFGGKV